MQTCVRLVVQGCPHASELLPHRDLGSSQGLGHDLIPSLSELCCPKNNKEMFKKMCKQEEALEYVFVY